MEKLRFETVTRKLAWRRDHPDRVSPHPLYVKKEGLLTEEEMAEAGLPETVSLSESVFRSVFRPYRADLIPLEIYRCSFRGKGILYLVLVAEPGPKIPGPALWTELELVMAVPDQPEPVPFAHTDHEDPGCLDDALVQLYQSVKTAVDLPSLSEQAEAIIDDYLD